MFKLKIEIENWFQLRISTKLSNPSELHNSEVYQLLLCIENNDVLSMPQETCDKKE